MVIVPVGDYEAHVRLWTIMLRTLIGWSDEQVARWAIWCKEASQDENDWFYHQPPEHYAAAVLTPSNIAKKLGSAKYYELEAAIQSVLQEALERAEMIEEINWHATKANIDAILAEYGESLSSVAAENSRRYLDELSE